MASRSGLRRNSHPREWSLVPIGGGSAGNSDHPPKPEIDNESISGAMASELAIRWVDSLSSIVRAVRRKLGFRNVRDYPQSGREHRPPTGPDRQSGKPLAESCTDAQMARQYCAGDIATYIEEAYGRRMRCRIEITR